MVFLGLPWTGSLSLAEMGELPVVSLFEQALGQPVELAMGASPAQFPVEDEKRGVARAIDESCYGGEAWRSRAAGSASSTDAEAVRIRGLRSWESFRDCADCPEMKVIPGGEFIMGSPRRREGPPGDEEPPHRVKITAFAVAKFELEWGAFQRFVTETARSPGKACRSWSEGNDSWDAAAGLNWAAPGYPQQAEHPAVCVSWGDARAYIAWLSAKTGKRYRLLSETEWEYAARANAGGQEYWAGARAAACRFGNFADATTNGELSWNDRFPCSDRWWASAPVGTFRPNAFGLYDMLGNVWEWVEDCANPDYANASGDGRPRTCGECGQRMIRGGSWSTQPSGVRFSNRARAPIDRRSVTTGFRVARDLE